MPYEGSAEHITSIKFEMLAFILRKIFTVIPTFFGITLVAFTLIRLVPGDPIEVMVGERKLDPEIHAAMMHRMGLDQPLYLQYFKYVKDLLHGDLGTSLVTREPVVNEFFALFPATVELTLVALVLAMMVGMPAGMIAGLKRGSAVDHGVMGVAMTGYSMPIFWWGLIMIMFFSVDLGWTPVSGRIAIEYDIAPRTGLLLIDTLLSGEDGAFLSACRHLILPVIV